jgi:hypothetical protein
MQMSRFSAMIDMAKDMSEVKKETAQMTAPMPADAKPSVAVYPYGLCISLEDEQLEKLGLDGELPSVGDMLHIAGMAKVTSASENEREMSDGTKQKCRRIELQFTHLATENEDEEGEQEARRSRFYGDDKAA